MGFAADVAGTVEDGSIKLEISGDDLGLLIGRRGGKHSIVCSILQHWR